MVEESDRIARDIAATRSSLVRDVDALADRTMPNRVVRRRWTQVKEKVMGTPQATGTAAQDRARSMADTVGDKASEVGHRAQEVGEDIADAVRDAPHAVAARTQGNPLAVGLIAFGAGLLVASLVPATEFEQGVGERLKENAPDMVEPIRQPLMESGQRIKEDVAESVGQAAGEVKQTAKESARTVADDTKAAAQQMTDRS
jgi:hypothetical protein